MTTRDITVAKIKLIINGILIAIMIYAGQALICGGLESYNAHQEASQ